MGESFGSARSEDGMESSWSRRMSETSFHSANSHTSQEPHLENCALFMESFSFDATSLYCSDFSGPRCLEGWIQKHSFKCVQLFEGVSDLRMTKEDKYHRSLIPRGSSTDSDKAAEDWGRQLCAQECWGYTSGEEKGRLIS